MKLKEVKFSSREELKKMAIIDLFQFSEKELHIISNLNLNTVDDIINLTFEEFSDLVKLSYNPRNKKSTINLANKIKKFLHDLGLQFKGEEEYYYSLLNKFKEGKITLIDILNIKSDRERKIISNNGNDLIIILNKLSNVDLNLMEENIIMFSKIIERNLYVLNMLYGQEYLKQLKDKITKKLQEITELKNEIQKVDDVEKEINLLRDGIKSKEELLKKYYKLSEEKQRLIDYDKKLDAEIMKVLISMGFQIGGMLGGVYAKRKK